MPVGERRRIPFTEKNGVYFGPPADDASAIAELERLRDSGAQYVAIAQWYYWYLTYYAGFGEYLARRYEQIWDGEYVKLFDLRTVK